MKRLILLFCAGGLTSILGVACDDKETYPPGAMQPVSANAEQTAFFDENIGVICHSILVSSNCALIDSADEFWEQMGGYEEVQGIYPIGELPAINFDKYTLVIGKWNTVTNFLVQKHYITTQEEGMVLNLVLKAGGPYFFPFNPLFYWGLYPKLSGEVISAKFIKID